MERIQYLKSKVRGYYQKNPPQAPPEFRKREFGAGDQKKIDYRHLSFKTEEDYKDFFVERAPLYASYSVGYYEFPSAQPMPNKKLQGADIVFEFDAECEHNTLACTECLEWAKQQTFKLIENFLIPDFGFDKQDIIISFSGNRGYHIHLRNQDVYSLDKKARKELIDYIQLNNVSIPKLLVNSNLESLGWKGKLAKDIYSFIECSDENSLKGYRFGATTIKKISERKQEILSGIRQGNFDVLKNGQRIWNKIAEKQLKKSALDIDASVTLDIARLIRLPTTIHSSTGFLDMYVKNLDAFNPFRDAVVFMNYPEKIKFKKAVSEFTLKDSVFGPYKEGEIAEVPEFAAVFCIGRDVAEPI